VIPRLEDRLDRARLENDGTMIQRVLARIQREQARVNAAHVELASISYVYDSETFQRTTREPLRVRFLKRSSA